MIGWGDRALAAIDLAAVMLLDNRNLRGNLLAVLPLLIVIEKTDAFQGVGQGTGLGLAIARQIVVENHQGTLEVNSTLGQGSEFVLKIPATMP